MVIGSIAVQHNHFTKWIESSDLIWQFFLLILAWLPSYKQNTAILEMRQQLERLRKVSDYGFNNLDVFVQGKKR